MPRCAGEWNVKARRGERTLSELRAFVSFLSSLWGILAGITVLFPLSNQLASAVPLPSGRETLSTVLASLFSVFIIFALFVSRSKVTVKLIERFPLFGSLLFLLSTGFLFVYLSLLPTTPGTFDVHLPFFYAAIFALYTLAFTLLALKEWISEGKRSAEQTGQYHSEVFPQEAIERGLVAIRRARKEKFGVEDKMLYCRNQVSEYWNGIPALKLFIYVEPEDGRGEVHLAWVDKDGNVLAYSWK